MRRPDRVFLVGILLSSVASCAGEGEGEGAAEEGTPPYWVVEAPAIPNDPQALAAAALKPFWQLEAGSGTGVEGLSPPAGPEPSWAVDGQDSPALDGSSAGGGVLSCDIVIDGGVIATHVCTEYAAAASSAIGQGLTETCNSSSGVGRGASGSPCAQGEIASCTVRDPFPGQGVSTATIHWYPGRDTQGGPSVPSLDGFREACMGTFAAGSGPLAEPPQRGAGGGANPTNPGTTPLGNAGYWGSCRQPLGVVQLCIEHETTGTVPAQIASSLAGLCTPPVLQPERCPRAGAAGACELRTAINASATLLQRMFSYGVSADVARSSCSGGTFIPISG